MNRVVLNIDEVFFAALEIADRNARSAYLDEICGGDADLRHRIEGLLAVNPLISNFLESPAVAPTATIDPPCAEVVGTTIGPYKLMEQIGEGGMGVVYVAEQHEPVRRKVALKVIKPGMDTKQVIARFEAERQALAMMDHPNIAKVFDGGTTDSGRPYFVMELVRGVAITEYCDREQLSIRDRLDLFVLVCRAVQHAHQKGIIHRDLKPSNILVTVIDGAAVPQVIDFGIAKATGAALAGGTIYTGFHQLVGTPMYMSPEQSDLAGSDVDTRSDIYSLGVLLYELLTGTTPFDGETLRKAAFDEMRRIIREVEPPTPSTRLGTLDESITDVSAKRATDPRHLNRSVRGELDWIAMKALEKDRRRRYETANDFAADVQRYLNNEPVLACPPVAGYRMLKFVSRNKGPVLAAAAIATSLLAGVAASTWMALAAMRAESHARAMGRNALRERDAKEEALRAEAGQRRLAQAQAKLAEEARGRAVASEADTRAYSEFLVKDVLAVARPRGERGGLGIGVSVKDAIDAAATKIGERFGNRPRAEALARHDLGVTYRLIGDLDKAEEQLRLAYDLRRKMLGPIDKDTLDSGNSLAVVYSSRGKFKLALPLHVETLEAQRRTLGEENSATLYSMNNLAETYKEVGRHRDAETLFLKALKGSIRLHGEDGELTLTVMGNLGLLHLAMGDHKSAESHLVKAMEGCRRVHGEENPATLSSMNALAGLYKARGRLAEAEALYVKTLEVRRRVLRAEHPDVLASMGNLAGVYQAQHRYAEAEVLYVEALKARLRDSGEEHPSTLVTMNSLALLYKTQGRLDEAEPLYCRALEVRRRVFGVENPGTLTSMNNMGGFLAARGKITEAEALYVETLKVRRRVLGEDHPDTLTSMNSLAVLYQDQGRRAEAEPLFRKALEALRRKLGADHPNTILCMLSLGSLFVAQSKLAEAEPLFREALDKARGRGEKGSPLVIGALGELGSDLIQLEKYAEAEPVLREYLEIFEPLAPDDWRVFSAKSMLGGSLLGQKRFAEAEPMLLAGYEGMRRREAKIPEPGNPRLTEALERLVRLYESTGKIDESATWRKQLESRKEAQKTPESVTKP